MTGPIGTIWLSTRVLACLVDVGCVIDDGRLAGLENQLAQRVLDRVGGAGEPVGLEADCDGDLEHSVLGEDHGHDVGVGEVGDALGDQTERVVAGCSQQLPGDVGRCLEPLLSSVRLLVEAGVLDRDTGGGRQRRDELLVLGAEVSPR